MKFSELRAVFPFHGWEEFPAHTATHKADQLLAAWTSLWHPALLAHSQALPRWHAVDDLPQKTEGCLLLLPTASREQLPGGGDSLTGGGVLHVAGERAQVVKAALALLEGEPAPVDGDLTASFFSLGFCQLQMEQLSRRMRSSPTAETSSFQEEVLAAAQAALAGKREAALEKLRACFDLLAQARQPFYPVESYLVDLLLVTRGTPPEALREELASSLPMNILLSGETLERLDPGVVAILREGVERGTVCIVGGGYEETDISLWPLEKILSNLQRGQAAYQRHLKCTPVVYGQRCFGLSSLLPQLLVKLGFRGALHVSLDGGHVPGGEQAKIAWQGLDGTSLDAIARNPLDASAADQVLGLWHHLANSMDYDHVATLCFARFPGTKNKNPWYDDLRGAAAFGTALGKFVTLDHYFAHTAAVSRPSRYEPDEYGSPLLQRLMESSNPDPISGQASVHAEHAATTATQTLGVMQQWIASTSRQAPSSRRASLNHIATSLAGQPGREPAYLAVNPTSSTWRTRHELPALAAPPERSEIVRLAAQGAEGIEALVDVPSLGFAWIQGGRSGGKPKEKAAELPLADKNLLRNEHFEATVNLETGALSAVRRHGRRGNLCAQQIVFQPPLGQEGDQNFSVMAADTVRVTALSEVRGEITSEGRLLDRHGSLLARFVQKVGLCRGSRVLDLEISLAPESLPPESLLEDPWRCYYGARFAWRDPAPQLWRSVAETCHPTALTRIESPHFIDVRGTADRLTIFSGGFSYHRRAGERVLDTILIAGQETARTFHLGVGIDVPHPVPLALARLLPAEELLTVSHALPRQPSGWLMHLDSKRVVATSWETLANEVGEVTGFRTRLLETEGEEGRVGLTTFRPATAALKTDYLGRGLAELSREGEKIWIDLAPYEWAQLEVRW